MLSDKVLDVARYPKILFQRHEREGREADGDDARLIVAGVLTLLTSNDR